MSIGVVPERAMSARVSVVMVTYHTGPVLMHAAAAALAAPDVAELVVVDNGNPPDMAARLRTLARRGDVTLVEGQGNVGFARGCNLGARAASGELLLFLNPDTAPEPNAASRMADALDGAARPAVVGARLIDPDGSEQRGARRGEVTPLSTALSLIGLDRFSRDGGLHREAEEAPGAPLEIPVVSGAAMLLRTEDFAALGGFDEGYFLHVEDIDICRRARAAGGAVIFAPRARVMHHGSTSDVSSLRVEWEKTKGFVRYFRKFSRGPVGKAGALALAAPVAAAIMGRALLKSVRPKGARR